MPCKLSHDGPVIHGPNGETATIGFTSDAASVFIVSASYNGQDLAPASFDVDQDRKGAALTFTVASAPNDLSVVFGMITNMDVRVKESCDGATSLRLFTFTPESPLFEFLIIGD